MRKSTQARSGDAMARRTLDRLAIAEGLARHEATDEGASTGPTVGGILADLMTARGTAEKPAPYMVSLSNDLPTTAYLVELRYFRDEPTELRLMTRADLTELLHDNITHAHYTGDDVEIVGMWRYDGGGKLTPLKLSSRGSSTDSRDYMHTVYEIHDPATDPASINTEARFTVTIDGRA